MNQYSDDNAGGNNINGISGPGVYAGLFLISLATLLFELLLTRIFSVTLWYHFAFMAVSVAMFGMTAGALLVYLKAEWFPREKTRTRLGQAALLFSLTAAASLVFHLWFPVMPPGHTGVSVSALAATFVVVAVPFVASGAAVCLALTRAGSRVGRFYAADLFGAGLGCAVLSYLLGPVDAPSAVVMAAALAALAAFSFFGRNARAGTAAAVAVAGAMAVLAAANVHGYRSGDPVLGLRWAKGQHDFDTLYERWNVFSHIRVFGNQAAAKPPRGFGMSNSCAKGYLSSGLHLRIDAVAGTPLTSYRGDTAPVGFLACDLTNLAHNIRRHANVLVIGAGGGRDVLSALVFDQDRVTAVELNREIIRAVNGVFGDLTGHLDRDPRVRFVNDEARSWLARDPARYDIIQISLIDTWAATASGAYVLTENSLYTTEAWDLFWSRLSDDGLLTVSRWYFQGRPGEAYRTTSLAAAALARAGVRDPRAHLFMARVMRKSGDEEAPDGAATLLLSKRPFSADELERLDEVCKKLEFEPVLTPTFSLDPTFGQIADGKGLDQLYKSFPINISPPTDNQPFFFNMLRLRDLFKSDVRDQGVMSFNMSAVSVLGTSLAVVAALTVLGIVIPLAATRNRVPLAGNTRRFVYFIGIGLGFMLVEISQLQRMAIFLGHPSYSLSVVLFSLLLASGTGSLVSGPADGRDTRRGAYLRLGLLLAALIAYGLVAPPMTHALAGARTPVRIAAAALSLAVPGFFMGMAFPLGMRSALREAPELAPWLWGMNGAASVLASVAAVAIALGLGVAAAFWTGVACYLITLAAFTAPRNV